MAVAAHSTTLQVMARLHSDKARQLGGIAVLALFLLLAASHYGEDTGERGFGVVIGGAIAAFALGYGLTPWVLQRIRRQQSSAHRARRHGSKSSRR